MTALLMFIHIVGNRMKLPRVFNLMMKVICRCEMAVVLDCDIIINKDELQSRYYVHCRSNFIEKDINTLISQLWVQLFFNQEVFSVKYYTTVNIPLNNKQTELHNTATDFG